MGARVDESGSSLLRDAAPPASRVSRIAPRMPRLPIRIHPVCAQARTTPSAAAASAARPVSDAFVPTAALCVCVGAGDAELLPLPLACAPEPEPEVCDAGAPEVEPACTGFPPAVGVAEGSG